MTENQKIDILRALAFDSINAARSVAEKNLKEEEKMKNNIIDAIDVVCGECGGGEGICDCCMVTKLFDRITIKEQVTEKEF